MKLTFGTDPEFFLKDGEGKFISAWGLFQGTKQEPFPLERGALQVDGNALEFNIDPAETEDEFAKNIEVVLAQIDEIMKEVSPELTKAFVPVAKFDNAYWDSIDPHAKILGCSPDFTVTGKKQYGPDIMETPVRTAAGHMQVGWRKPAPPNRKHFKNCLRVAQVFHESKVFAPETKEEFERLKYYGNDGAFRHTPFGVEIRSPSNLWVATEEGRRDIFRKTSGVMQKLVEA